MTQSLWRYRHLLSGLIARNIKVKYQNSVLGFVWTLLNPLVMAIVLITVFGYVVRIEIEHYWAFMISGFFVWNYLSSSISAASYTLAQHAHITRSIAFPSELLIVGAAVSRLVELCLELLLVMIILAVWHHGAAPASYMLVPLLLLLLLLLTLGLQLPTAMLSVFYRDVEHALPAVLLALFYLTPVFYPVSLIPEWLRPWYMLNPIAELVTAFHDVLYLGVFPPAQLLLSVTLKVAMLCGLGYALFNRNKKVFAEIL